MTDDYPWRKSYPAGIPHTLEYPETPFFHFLDKAAEVFPDRLCTEFRGARQTFRQVHEASGRLAAGLSRLGVKKGSRVGLIMPNTPQFVIAFFAALRLGAVVTPIAPAQPDAQLENLLAAAGVETVLVMANEYVRLKGLQPRTRIRTVVAANIKEALGPVTGFLFSLLRERKDGYHIELEPGDRWMQELIDSHQPGDHIVYPLSPEDPAMLHFTAGPGSSLKGVVSLHSNLVASSLQHLAWLQGTLADFPVVIPAMSLAHPHALIAGMVLALASGGKLILSPNTAEALETVKRNRDALVVCRASALESDLPPLPKTTEKSRPTVFLITGSPLPLKERRPLDARADLLVLECYGLAEMVWGAAMSSPEADKYPTAGLLPLPDVEMRIVDPIDRMRVLQPGETGELVLRGPQLMPGYPGLPTENFRSMRDGWFFTGERAKMDENGELFLTKD